MPTWLVETIGWIGSTFVVLSLAMRSILRLRLLGLVGASAFALYGALLRAWPIAIVNVVIVAIHLWFLRAILTRHHETFRLLEVAPDSDYLSDFLMFYADEIEVTAPGFSYEAATGQRRWFVLRDMVPAGLIIGRWTDESTFEVDLDFAIPQYRDSRLGRFAFSPKSGLSEGRHPVTITALAPTDDHVAYLRRLGFRRDPDGRYRLTPS